MPQYDSSSYPLVSTINQDDRVLFWQDAEGRNARVKFSNIAAFISSGGDQITISGLRAKDVSALSTGAASVVGGYYTLGDGGGGLFFYDATATDADNGGTIIEPDSGVGRWFRPATETYNVREFGALGDGSHNDTAAIQAAVDVVSVNNRGSVYIPSGKYKISATIELTATPDANIAIFGDGPNVSIINQTQVGSGGLDFSFKNTGIQQPYTCTIRDLGFESTVVAGTAIIVSYGDPASTSEHYYHGPLIQNVGVRSNGSGYWSTGIDLESAWNAKITDCFISGSPFGGTWTSLIGSGIRLRRLCANTHILNNSINFWGTGVYYSAEGPAANNPNAEGLFCSNNSLVAIRRGVWIQGNSSASSPWMTGFQWNGGLIELRGGLAGIQLEACSQARVNGTYIIDGATGAGAIGVYMGTCTDVIISSNQVYALDFGVVTVGTCTFIEVADNAFRGGGAQVTFAVGCSESRSHGNIVNGAPRQEINNAAAIGSQTRIGSPVGISRVVGANNRSSDLNGAITNSRRIPANTSSYANTSNPRRNIDTGRCGRIKEAVSTRKVIIEIVINNRLPSNRSSIISNKKLVSLIILNLLLFGFGSNNLLDSRSKVSARGRKPRRLKSLLLSQHTHLQRIVSRTLKRRGRTPINRNNSSSFHSENCVPMRENPGFPR